jgi:nitrogen fixation NifU-like protein
VSGDLQDLYQEVILDHNRRPRNFRVIAGAAPHEGYNPLCGDHLTVYLDVDGDMIRDVSFQGSGCAISKASASLLTESVRGKTVADAASLIDRFHRFLTEEPPAPPADLGKLAVLGGVRQFPARVKCASLAWHTLAAAVEARDEVVSTE